MSEYIWLLYCLLPLAAFLYASVGHGGASSYIMLLTFFNFAPDIIRPTALILNILVSSIAFLWYFNKDTFPIKLFVTLVLFSIPASYLGGTIEIEQTQYRHILGLLLLFPVARLLGIIQPLSINVLPRWWLVALIGALIGFVSGIIGIGGGIILSPILILLMWSDIKQTSAVSSLFIFVNSIAGLIGAYKYIPVLATNIVWMMALAIIAGIFGAYLGAKKFNLKMLKYMLSIVLVVASVKFLLA
jgi:uncharacterized membrane protein YfcA